MSKSYIEFSTDQSAYDRLLDAVPYDLIQQLADDLERNTSLGSRTNYTAEQIVIATLMDMGNDMDAYNELKQLIDFAGDEQSQGRGRSLESIKADLEKYHIDGADALEAMYPEFSEDEDLGVSDEEIEIDEEQLKQLVEDKLNAIELLGEFEDEDTTLESSLDDAEKLEDTDTPTPKAEHPETGPVSSKSTKGGTAPNIPTASSAASAVSIDTSDNSSDSVISVGKEDEDAFSFGQRMDKLFARIRQISEKEQARAKKHAAEMKALDKNFNEIHASLALWGDNRLAPPRYLDYSKPKRIFNRKFKKSEEKGFVQWIEENSEKEVFYNKYKNIRISVTPQMITLDSKKHTDEAAAVSVMLNLAEANGFDLERLQVSGSKEFMDEANKQIQEILKKRFDDVVDEITVKGFEDAKTVSSKFTFEPSPKVLAEEAKRLSELLHGKAVDDEIDSGLKSQIDLMNQKEKAQDAIIEISKGKLKRSKEEAMKAIESLKKHIPNPLQDISDEIDSRIKSNREIQQELRVKLHWETDLGKKQISSVRSKAAWAAHKMRCFATNTKFTKPTAEDFAVAKESVVWLKEQGSKSQSTINAASRRAAAQIAKDFDIKIPHHATLKSFENRMKNQDSSLQR